MASGERADMDLSYGVIDAYPKMVHVFKGTVANDGAQVAILGALLGTLHVAQFVP